MKTTFACKHCGKMETSENPYKFGADELVKQETCHRCHDKAVVNSALAVGFTNLHNLINQLNAWDFTQMEDGEILDTESAYRFKYKVDGKHITIYDDNEYFNMNLDDEIRATMYYASKEFGFEYKTPESTVERILGQFKEALEKDLKKKDIVIEWDDNVTLSVYA